MMNSFIVRGVKFDDYMRQQMAAQHYSALINGSSLQDIFTDPNILQKTASSVVDALKNSPLRGTIESFQKVFGKVPDGEGGTIKTPWGDLPLANNGIQLARQGFQSFFNDPRKVNNPRVGARGVQPFGQPQPPEVDLRNVGSTPTSPSVPSPQPNPTGSGGASSPIVAAIPPMEPIPPVTPTRPAIPFQFAKDANYRIEQNKVVKVLSDLGFTNEATHIADVGLYHGIGDVQPALLDKALSFKQGENVLEDATNKYAKR